MWNNRYAVDEYIYGTDPNSFLKENAKLLVGPVLSLAEGEGRNAVFLAQMGLEVHGVDGSEIGLAKAQSLAKLRGVQIQTEVADLGVFKPEAEKYGSVISIFAHLPSAIRARLYPLVARSVKPGGIIILESYSESQYERTTGGPKDLDMLMTTAKVKNEFPAFEPLILREIEREVSEGTYHTGLASVVQFVGKLRSGTA